jgi:hypothetical protein
MITEDNLFQAKPAFIVQYQNIGAQLKVTSAA